MNLFVVDTPLQLLNVIEARAAFSLADCTIIVLLWPQWRRESFDLIIRDNSLQNVEYFPMLERKLRPQPVTAFDRILDRLREYTSELSQLVFRQRFDRNLGRFSHVTRLYVGNYRNDYMKHVANIVPYQELILLDDGTDTLRAAKERYSRLPQNSQPAPGLVRRLKNRFRRKYIDWDCLQAPAVTFFSSYEIQCTGHDRIVHNDYARLRARMQTTQHTDEIYFLGQPLVADGYLANTTYAAYLGEISNYFSGRKLFYIPHPREIEADYLDLATALKFEIMRFNSPVEIALCSATRAPSVIASLFCSALENCSFLYQDRVDIVAFEIRDDDLLCCHELVASSYTHFRLNRGKSIRVIPLGSVTAQGPDTSQSGLAQEQRPT